MYVVQSFFSSVLIYQFPECGSKVWKALSLGAIFSGSDLSGPVSQQWSG